jgi:hypothetical protein
MTQAAEIAEAVIAVVVILTGLAHMASAYSKRMREQVATGFQALFFTIGVFTLYAGISLFPT